MAMFGQNSVAQFSLPAKPYRPDVDVMVQRLCPTLPDGTKVVINLSGRGDKDVNTAAKYLDTELSQ